MNEAQQNLARRLVEHPAWRWMPGMRLMEFEAGRAWRLCAKDERADSFHLTQESWRRLRQPAPCISTMSPDLTDPATVGCLLVLAREAWGDPGAYAVGSDVHGWTVCVLVVAGDATGVWPFDEHRHATEGEALAHAILAAPTKETT